MTTVIQILLVTMLATDLSLAANSRLGTCINIVSIQGFALGLLPAVIGFEVGMSVDLVLISVIGIVLRGMLFPRLLHKSIRGTNIRREEKPLVGYFGSTLVVLVLFAMSLWMSSRLAFINQEALLIATVALTTIFAGTFLIVARRLAVMQIIGYVLLENGIYCIGLTLVRQIPLLVELGVLFDAIVAVFVMSVATNKIHDEFEHLDVQRLDTLKG